MRRIILAAAALALSMAGAANRASATETITIGTMQLTTAGGIILAEANGDFAREGLEIKHVWAQAAQDTVMAAAAGSVDLAVGSFTASFYNLAGKGAFKVIWGQTREAPGFHNNGFMVNNATWDAGVRGIKDFPGHRIGITTTGGGLHYAIGLLARKYGFPMSSITLVPMQSFPNLAAAFKGGQIEIMAAASGVIIPIEPMNVGHVIAWSGDETPWQLGAVFLRPQVIATRRPMVEAFLRAYKRGCAMYHNAVNAVDASGAHIQGPGYDQAIATMSTALNLRPHDVEQSIGFMPEDCALDVADIRNQVDFWKSEKLIDQGINADALLDLSFGAKE